MNSEPLQILQKKVKELKNQGKINLITPCEVIDLKGENNLTSVILQKENGQEELATDYFIPLFGLTPKLGPIADWGLEIERNAIKVNNALDYQTNIEGVYAIGDVNTYPGKLKLILCGFHEATLMCQGVYNRLYPNKKICLKNTLLQLVQMALTVAEKKLKKQLSNLSNNKTRLSKEPSLFKFIKKSFLELAQMG